MKKKYEEKTYIINQSTLHTLFTFDRSADSIYDIEILTVDINLNKINNKISKASIIIGANEVYNKSETDNYCLTEFNTTNPIPLKYLEYNNVQLDITTNEPNQLILIKYKQKYLKSIETPFYITPNIQIENGIGIPKNPSELKNIPCISKYI